MPGLALTIPQLDWLPTAVRTSRPVWRPVVEVKPSPVGGAEASRVVLMVAVRRMSTVTLTTWGLAPPAKVTVSVKLRVDGLGTLLETTNWKGVKFAAWLFAAIDRKSVV